MDLVQGTLSIDEHEVQFVRLSQYALELVSSEINHFRRFRCGMNRKVKLYLVAQSIEVFDELVKKACTLEETLGEDSKVASSGAMKRSTEATSGSDCKGKRGRFGRSE